MRATTFIIFSALSFIPLWGADFPVTTAADSGPGSLRQAIQDLNGASGTNTITFAGGLGTITLQSNLPEITSVGIFVMPSGETLTIDGTGGGPFFRIWNGYY